MTKVVNVVRVLTSIFILLSTKHYAEDKFNLFSTTTMLFAYEISVGVAPTFDRNCSSYRNLYSRTETVS